eukprot:scaffold60025_cov35-Attheya_sp.AAC.1
MTASKAVLEHHFNNHEFCGDWCPAKRGIKKGSYRCKEEHSKFYESLKGVMDVYATPERMRELHHEFSTQGNEAMDNAVTSRHTVQRCRYTIG